MTISDISNKLFTFFASNDSFSLSKNLIDIYPIYDSLEIAQASIKQTLKSFEEKGIVVKLDIAEDHSWLLTKAIHEYSQTIEVSYPTITLMASTINEICEEWDAKKGKVNPLEINEQDIHNLLVIIDTFRKNNLEQNI